MDGAPLMIRFDNDHHGTLDAEGGRRPPHHRNSNSDIAPGQARPQIAPEQSGATAI
jgi:hypothetical protein